MVSIFSVLVKSIKLKKVKGGDKLDFNEIGLKGDPDFYRMGAISRVLYWIMCRYTNCAKISMIKQKDEKKSKLLLIKLYELRTM